MYFCGTTLSQFRRLQSIHFNGLHPILRSQVSKISQSALAVVAIWRSCDCLGSGVPRGSGGGWIAVVARVSSGASATGGAAPSDASGKLSLESRAVTRQIAAD